MEKRKFERYRVRQFKSVHPQNQPFPYKVMNISKSGCAVRSSETLEECGGKILIDLPLPSETQSLCVEAKVVRENRFEEQAGASSTLYGLSFEEMDHVSCLILDAYLGFLRRDKHIAQLEDAWEKLKNVQEKIEVLMACEEKKQISYIH